MFEDIVPSNGTAAIFHWAGSTGFCNTRPYHFVNQQYRPFLDFDILMSGTFWCVRAISTAEYGGQTPWYKWNFGLHVLYWFDSIYTIVSNWF